MPSPSAYNAVYILSFAQVLLLTFVMTTPMLTRNDERLNLSSEPKNYPDDTLTILSTAYYAHLTAQWSCVISTVVDGFRLNFMTPHLRGLKFSIFVVCVLATFGLLSHIVGAGYVIHLVTDWGPGNENSVSPPKFESGFLLEIVSLALSFGTSMGAVRNVISLERQGSYLPI